MSFRTRRFLKNKARRIHRTNTEIYDTINSINYDIYISTRTNFTYLIYKNYLTTNLMCCCIFELV